MLKAKDKRVCIGDSRASGRIGVEERGSDIMQCGRGRGCV